MCTKAGGRQEGMEVKSLIFGVGKEGDTEICE